MLGHLYCETEQGLIDLPAPPTDAWKKKTTCTTVSRTRLEGRRAYSPAGKRSLNGASTALLGHLAVQKSMYIYREGELASAFMNSEQCDL